MGGGACFFFLAEMIFYGLLIWTTGIEPSENTIILLLLVALLIYTKED